MSLGNRDAGYAIGDVVRMLSSQFPDISVSSLRFLEREGLIEPERRSGGHRRYSVDDVERIRTIKLWQRAHLSLKEIADRLAHYRPDEQLGVEAEEIVSLVRSGHPQEAAERVVGLHHSGTALPSLCERVLLPALAGMGDAWASHGMAVDPQLEFDEAIVAILSQITSGMEPSQDAPVILAACPTWERHDLALRMLGAVLQERGVRVSLLGAGVEPAIVQSAAARIHPDVLLASMTTSVPAEQATLWLHDVAAGMMAGTRLMIGGDMASSLQPLPSPWELVTMADASALIMHDQATL